MLPDVPVRLLKDRGVWVQLVVEQRPAEVLLHLSRACVCVLPVVETHCSHNIVDVVDDPLDHDGRLAVRRLHEDQRPQFLAGKVAPNRLENQNRLSPIASLDQN